MFGRAAAIAKDTFWLFSEKRAASHGAALAFYTVTSIAPILLVVIAIAGLAFGADAARGAIFAQFQGLIGQQGAALLQQAIASASNKTDGIVASAISIGTLILTASGVFLELEDSLNTLW